jgi:alkylation response protein AidB-like acyl-CoA dehydrogenase
MAGTGSAAARRLEVSLGYPPSEEGREALGRVREFLDDVALPMVGEYELSHGRASPWLEPDGRLAAGRVELKKRVQQASAEAGLYCPQVPPAFGGLGLGLVDLFYIQEEVFLHGLDGAEWMLSWTEGPNHVIPFWSEESKERYLADFLGGRINICNAVTEESGGSDFLSMTTTARPDDGGWILNGRKFLITGGPVVEVGLIFARVAGAPREEISAFLVPLDAPGVERVRVLQTLMLDGYTGELAFHDVRVPGSALVGNRGDGLRFCAMLYNWIRSRRGGMCSGLARYCLDRSLDYARTREAFGQPVIGFGGVGSLLTDMHMDALGMRAVSLDLLARFDHSGGLLEGRMNIADRRDIAVLKTWNEEALLRIADRAIQIHGGRGLLTETKLEKIYRVARNLRIPGGTTELQRAAIAETFLADETAETMPTATA